MIKTITWDYKSETKAIYFSKDNIGGFLFQKIENNWMAKDYVEKKFGKSWDLIFQWFSY